MNKAVFTTFLVLVSLFFFSPVSASGWDQVEIISDDGFTGVDNVLTLTRKALNNDMTEEGSPLTFEETNMILSLTSCRNDGIETVGECMDEKDNFGIHPSEIASLSDFGIEGSDVCDSVSRSDLPDSIAGDRSDWSCHATLFDGGNCDKNNNAGEYFGQGDSAWIYCLDRGDKTSVGFQKTCDNGKRVSKQDDGLCTNELPFTITGKESYASDLTPLNEAPYSYSISFDEDYELRNLFVEGNTVYTDDGNLPDSFNFEAGNGDKITVEAYDPNGDTEEYVLQMPDVSTEVSGDFVEREVPIYEEKNFDLKVNVRDAVDGDRYDSVTRRRVLIGNGENDEGAKFDIGRDTESVRINPGTGAVELWTLVRDNTPLQGKENGGLESVDYTFGWFGDGMVRSYSTDENHVRDDENSIPKAIRKHHEKNNENYWDIYYGGNKITDHWWEQTDGNNPDIQHDEELEDGQDSIWADSGNDYIGNYRDPKTPWIKFPSGGIGSDIDTPKLVLETDKEYNIDDGKGTVNEDIAVKTGFHNELSDSKQIVFRAKESINEGNTNGEFVLYNDDEEKTIDLSSGYQTYWLVIGKERVTVYQLDGLNIEVQDLSSQRRIEGFSPHGFGFRINSKDGSVNSDEANKVLVDYVLTSST